MTTRVGACLRIWGSSPTRIWSEYRSLLWQTIAGFHHKTWAIDRYAANPNLSVTPLHHISLISLSVGLNAALWTWICTTTIKGHRSRDTEIGWVARHGGDVRREVECGGGELQFGSRKASCKVRVAVQGEGWCHRRDQGGWVWVVEVYFEEHVGPIRYFFLFDPCFAPIK